MRYREKIKLFKPKSRRSDVVKQAMMALQEMAVLNGFNVIYGFAKFFILIY